MDGTPSFGVTMISEAPSNPQLTLGVLTHLRKNILLKEIGQLLLAYKKISLSTKILNWYVYFRQTYNIQKLVE